ncbi:SH3 domain-containing protein [Viridibacillus sp. YIM B01967]|uniref:D-alanyl-D-alanine dipeptidase n=1 Tax=Viridibacillus soli TaxID=2798301 RepID=A0ABS1HAL3_9BACL|nr:M15 family metallopeptidase [Viridibacillus soli]MBK3496450.1 SH3 domain-containing protein [Viridibacillus soli]
MKLNMKKVFIASSMIGLLFAIGFAGLTQTVSAQASIAKKSLNKTLKATASVKMRKGIGTNYKKITTVEKGIFVQASKYSKGWYKVSVNGKTGWISGKYLTAAPANFKEAGLVEVSEKDGFIIDLKYATKKNFMGYALYPEESKALVTKSTAVKLKKANRLANKQGYKIKIWDVYRPLSVQWEMYNKIQNHLYVANPALDSNHSKGVSVDVTLVDSKGKELKMPTKFDSFSVKAGRSYKGNSKITQKNMDYLTKIMTQSDFKTISSEWWHYNDLSTSHPTLDLPTK